jgi:hypothetical protein
LLQETDDESNQATHYKMHFMAVASRTSSTHVMYKRDLLTLLDFAMEIRETDLALDLGTWVAKRKVFIAQTRL